MKIKILVLGLISLLLYSLFSCGSANKEKTKTEVSTDSLPSLTRLLEDKVADFKEKASPEMVRTIEEGIREVAASGVMESALKKGDKAPDFELPDATGKIVRLSDLLKSGPVVLTWYRGGW